MDIILEINFVPYRETLKLMKLGFDLKKAKEPWFNTYTTDNHPSLKPGILVGVKPSEPLMSSQMDKIGVWNIPAPLYQQAFNWLLEKHMLFAETTLWGDGIGYMSNIKEIRQEKFLEVYNLGLATPQRGLPNWDKKKEDLACLTRMIELVKEHETNSTTQPHGAGSVIYGKVCIHCGTEFIKKHGYPVLCNGCFFEASEQDKEIYEKATEIEIK